MIFSNQQVKQDLIYQTNCKYKYIYTHRHEGGPRQTLKLDTLNSVLKFKRENVKQNVLLFPPTYEKIEFSNCRRRLKTDDVERREEFAFNRGKKDGCIAIHLG